MTFSTGCAATATSSGAGAAGQGVRHVRLLACAAQGVFYGGAARGLLDAGRGAGPVARGAAGFGWRASPGLAGWVRAGRLCGFALGWQVVRWLWRAWRTLQVVRSSSRLSWWKSDDHRTGERIMLFVRL